ncbi:hypothetical protein, partial [Armatimonas sp.]|uniref:portal protein n=1 Tax=Armatimonas sp. TaxID=1872638 RepID=UPI0037534A53
MAKEKLGIGGKKTVAEFGASLPQSEIDKVENNIAAASSSPDLASFWRKRFNESKASRQDIEADMVTGWLMETGQQWAQWDSSARQVRELQVAGNEPETLVVDNLSGMLVEKVASIVTSGAPDVAPVALSGSPLDRAATEEAKAMFAAEDVRQNRRNQRFNHVRWALVTGEGWILPRWNATALVPVAEMQGGQIASRKSAPLGAMSEEAVSGLEIFLDPLAPSVNESDYVIHATVKSVAWVRSLIGKETMLRKGINPDAKAGGALSPAFLDHTEQLVAARSTAANEANAYSVLDCWALPKPGSMFPEGLRCVIVAGHVAYCGYWPYEKKDAYPFIPLAWKQILGSCRGRGLMAELAPLQVAYNRCLTDVINYMENAVPTILLPEGGDVTPGAYSIEHTKSLRVIVANLLGSGGVPPQWQNAPAVPGDIYRLKDWIWGDMQHRAGIHDPSLGTVSGDASGVSISLLQQSDQTQHAPFLAAIEEAARHVREWEVALYSQFAAPWVPRIVGLDEKGNPAGDKFQAVALRALTGGGQVGIHLAPGSAIATTPAAKEQKAQGWHDKG